MAKSTSMMRSWLRVFWRSYPPGSNVELSWTLYRYARRYNNFDRSKK